MMCECGWRVVSKDVGKVVLKDAANKRIEVPADGVEVMAPQQKSLMPELLLRERQPVAAWRDAHVRDVVARLIDYVSDRKFDALAALQRANDRQLGAVG